MSSPGGTITVKDGSRIVKSRVALRSGKAVIILSKPKRGRHTYTFTYSGTSTIVAATSRLGVYIP